MHNIQICIFSLANRKREERNANKPDKFLHSNPNVHALNGSKGYAMALKFASIFNVKECVCMTKTFDSAKMIYYSFQTRFGMSGPNAVKGVTCVSLFHS